MNWVLPSNWADAKLAERQAFNRISEARNQADWLKAWETWTSAVQRLRQEARHPEFDRMPESESEIELLSEHQAAIGV
jgi:hypothetical protein